MLAWLTIVLAAVPDTVETKSGLPQLNTNDMAPQLIWLALTFIALYWALSRFTLPRIASVIEERKNRIERDIAEGERLNKETQNAIAEYEQKLADARGKAGAMVKENRDAVTAELEAKRQAAEAEDQARMAAAEERINAMKSEAMAQVTTISTETAQELIKKLVGAEISAEEIQRAMQQPAGGQQS
ncbi:MAG: F0F1 ATP synthase subunit B' [Alphaproteobacteria bacterium]|nr:F0F1 ATP synthase subunit B' [Alphaproteobacteria bacterium]